MTKWPYAVLQCRIVDGHIVSANEAAQTLGFRSGSKLGRFIPQASGILAGEQPVVVSKIRGGTHSYAILGLPPEKEQMQVICIPANVLLSRETVRQFAGISASLTALTETLPDEKMATLLQNQASSMARLAEKLQLDLDINQPAAHDQPQLVSLGSLLQVLVQNRHVELSKFKSSHYIVLGYERYLRHLLEHLLDNVRQYDKEDGRVRASLRTRGDYVHITLRWPIPKNKPEIHMKLETIAKSSKGDDTLAKIAYLHNAKLWYRCHDTCLLAGLRVPLVRQLRFFEW